MKRTAFLILALSTTLLSCGTQEDSPARGRLDKADQLAGSCGSGQETSCGGQSADACWCDDQCSSFGDCCADVINVCDEFNPCAGASCGDGCSPCAPNDPECFTPSIPFACDADLSCVGAVLPPSCDGTPDSCAGKSCGDSCSPPGPSPATPHACSADGLCAEAVTAPECGGSNGEHKPCAGHACGESCSPCATDDPDCFSPATPFTCNATGSCVETLAQPSCEESQGATCQARCGETSKDGSCFCDTQCQFFGDCCTDRESWCI